MTHYKLALLGFGNVGQALARLLLTKRDDLEDRFGLTFSVTGIATGSHGSAINQSGIDLLSALEWIKTGGELNPLSDQPIPENSLEFIQNCGADVLFENTPVDYQSGQPATDHLRAALKAGMHAITANKGPVVHAYQELSELAQEKERKFFFEATVMDGAPIFSLFRGALPAAHLRGFRGILNSTTNLILNRMEAGATFDEAVSYAQSIGIAETDPSGDIDGWDAAIKVAALATVLMDAPIKPTEVDRQGIRDLTQERIKRDLERGERWKLVCSARKEGDKVKARVAPEKVRASSPFYSVNGTTSIVRFESDVLGELSIIETDPGPHTTAYGLLADFINAVR